MIAAIVCRGFGPAAAIKFVVTRGYFPGATPPPTLPSRPNEGRLLFPTSDPAPAYATKIFVNQACSMFLALDVEFYGRLVAIDFELLDTKLNFIRPDGTPYVVLSTAYAPLIYTTFLLGQQYVVYTFLTGELDQAGKWGIYYTVDEDYISPTYQFTVYH